MNSLSEKGKTRLGIAVLLISVIVFGLIITPAGFMIAAAGSEMAGIRSVGGNSVAEAYYQLHGVVYISMGIIIACVSLVICFGGTAFSVRLLKVNKDTLKAMSNEIKAATDDIKERTVRAAHEFSKEKTYSNTVTVQTPAPVQNSAVENVENVCPNCKQPVSSESVFCTRCGFKLNNEV